MPKQRITKKMVVDAAFHIARQQGMEHVMVKSIAHELGCSVQPIYSYCSCMDSLKNEVVKQTGLFIKEFFLTHIDRNNYFKSTGYAHILLAKEEPHLFKLFFLRPRSDVHSLRDIYNTETNPEIPAYISDTLSISLTKAKQLHMHMLIYNMGLSFILATSGTEIPTEELYKQLEEAYQIFLTQTTNE